MRNLCRYVLATLVSLTVAACATYYKVTDPASGKNFYTTKVNRSLSGTVSASNLFINVNGSAHRLMFRPPAAGSQLETPTRNACGRAPRSQL